MSHFPLRDDGMAGKSVDVAWKSLTISEVDDIGVESKGTQFRVERKDFYSGSHEICGTHPFRPIQWRLEGTRHEYKISTRLDAIPKHRA